MIETSEIVRRRLSTSRYMRMPKITTPAIDRSRRAVGQTDFAQERVGEAGPDITKAP